MTELTEDILLARMNPGLHRVQSIIKEIRCGPYEFEVWPLGQSIYGLHAMLYRQDSNTGQWGWGFGGVQVLHGNGQPDSPSVDNIVKRCFVAARDYSEHEVREAFTYKGRRVFDPHQSVENLWEISRDV